MKKNRLLSIIIAVSCVIVLVGVDQLSKYIANHNEVLLSGQKIMFIKHILSFRLSYNTGAAWSILEGKKFLLVSVSVIASIIFLGMLVKLVDFKNNILLSIALILIDAGAIGNLIDRAFFEKGVIDFLNFEFMNFPIFNFADTCLTIGACVLVVYIIFFYKEEDRKNKDQNNNLSEGETSC